MKSKFITKLKKKIRENKYRNLNPASNGSSMNEFADWVKNWSKLKVQNIFEIGANYAQDAEGLMLRFGLKHKDVWVFEAHPDLYKKITEIHKFNAFNYAAYNEKKELEFNICAESDSNTGISSILENNFNKLSKKVSVQAIRMDDFMKENHIDQIDFLKLDAEGCNYEVLQGFGDRLNDVNAIHIEAEHSQLWVGQKLYDDIAQILLNSGFVLIKFQRYIQQSDSFWIQQKFMKEEYK